MRILSANRTLATHRALATNRHIIGGYSYSAKFTGAQSISLPTTFNPASFQNDWTLRVKLMYFKSSGSNQNIVAQTDGVGAGANGRIWMLIRSTGVLSSFFAGVFQDSSFTLRRRKWYDLFLRFEFLSYNAGANKAVGNLHYNVNGVNAGVVNNVDISDAYGTHLIGVSKAGGGFLQDAVIPRVELYKVGLTDDEMMDICKNETKFYSDENETLDTDIYEYRYAFSEGTGASTTDSSGNGYNATLSHNSWSNKVPNKARQAVS